MLNGSTANQTSTLSASTGTPGVSLTKSANSDWLVLPSADLGSLPFGINSASLAPGTYISTVTASAEGYAEATLQVTLTVTATSYYFSTTDGDDDRTAAQARSPATPWKTTSKLNTFFANLQPGDNVLFKRGDTFYGSITIGKSGTSTASITIGAYGIGERPVITGLTTINGWTDVGGGVYESSVTTALLPHLNMLLINGVQYGMGRYPDTDAADGGYLKFESFVGTTSITDAQLTETPYDWQGAEVVIKPWSWLLNRSIITNHVGGTLSFVGDQQPRSAGYGYFIQNDPRTLTAFGEWYHNKTTEKIRIYFGDALPSSYLIQATTVDSLVYSTGKSYIRFCNLTFKGANANVFDLNGTSTNFFIDSCDILFAGIDGINTAGSYTGFKLTNSNVWDCNDNCVLALATTSAIIRDNYIRNSYMIPGMGGERDGHGWSIRTGLGGTVEYNRVINSGYIGIDVGGENSTIQYNYIDSFCLVKDDGGGIYTSNGLNTTYINRLIKQNIILNGIGCIYGTPSLLAGCNSIYMDNRANGVTIEGNTIAFSNGYGMLFHNGKDMTVSNNTFWNNRRGAFHILDDNSAGETVGLNIKSNLFITKYATEPTITLSDDFDAITGFGTFDSNYYAGLLGNNTSILNVRNYIPPTNYGDYEYHDLASWKLRYGKDANSSYSLKNIAPYRDLFIVGSDKIPAPDNNAVFNVCCSQWAGAAVYSADPAHDMAGGHLVVTPNPTSKGADVALSVGSVLAGTPYILRFSVKGSTYSDQGSFGVRMQVGSTYTDYQYYKIKATVEQVEMMFIPTVNSSGTIRFSVAEGGTPFYLDNIHFYQATATVTNPSDSIRFEYNDTKVNKVVSLTGNYMDVRGRSYTTGSITLLPFTSEVLVKFTDETAPIEQVNPAITWANPSAIIYGTALSSTQINATASTAGTFVYTPVSETVYLDLMPKHFRINGLCDDD